MPLGALVTLPNPPRFTVSVYTGAGPPPLNSADTFLAASILTVHGPVPLQAPLHAMNVDPGSGAAVSVTTVPLVKLDVQDTPQ